MRIPLSWLKEFLPSLPDLSVVVSTLTNLGIEVDAVEPLAPRFGGVRVVEILEVQVSSDPSALRIAEIFDGKNKQRVVCAASNCRKGLLAAWAPPGSHLPDGEGTLTIQAKEIQGVASYGMLCSLDELGLEASSDGIWEIGSGLELGQEIAAYCSDTVLHLSLTPNLGHCMSVLGIARELAAALEIPLVVPPLGTSLVGLPQSRQVQIDPACCSQYTVLQAVLPNEVITPFLMQHRLRLSGQRSIGFVVDLTNYVLLGHGQPMHAFDADEVKGTISVRLGKPGEQLLLLNDQKVDVANSPIIADERGPLALAGIMGGKPSAVTAKTRRLLIECAVFYPSTVRKTSKALGVRSDSSQHYERGVDEGACRSALQRMADLLQGHAGFVEGLTQAGNLPVPRCISYNVEWGNRRLGFALSAGEIQKILEGQRCCVTATSDEGIYLVQPPSDRNDLQQPIDLVEELARCYGYDHIPRPTLAYQPGALPAHPTWTQLQTMGDQLVRLGLQEVITSTLLGPEAVSWLSERPVIAMANPSSVEHSILRPSLLPGLLEVLRQNQARRSFQLALFELGQVHTLEAGTADPIKAHREPWHLGLLVSGPQDPINWESTPAAWDFFHLKGVLERWLQLGYGLSLELVPSQDPLLHPLRQGAILCEGIRLGLMGEIHPSVLEQLGLRDRPLVAELDLEPILARTAISRSLPPPPEFPSVERDLTLALPGHTPVGIVEALIERHHPEEMQEWAVTSVFVDPQTPDQRRVTWRFQYRGTHRTLTSEEVDGAQMALVEKLASALASQ